MREGIRQVIDRHHDLEVVADCADLPELRALIEHEPPDVVVTDVRMPPTFSDEGIQMAVELREPIPTSAWSCCRSTPSRRTPARCSPAAARGRGVPAQGAGQRTRPAGRRRSARSPRGGR